MARSSLLAVDGAAVGCTLSNLDRARLYGSCRRLMLDRRGAPCHRAELTDDGALVLQPGMTALACVDEDDCPHSVSELVGLSPGGSEAPSHEETTDRRLERLTTLLEG